MKTKQVLDKYRKILAPILECKEEDIDFYISGRGDTYQDRAIVDKIGELTYQKNSDWGLGYYTVKCKNVEVSTWKLYQLPHCCAFMVSCNVHVYKSFRNKRIGTILNQLRQDIGRILGYSAILCTDIESNTNQRKLLATNGWKDIHSIVNKRTTNRVYLSVINI